MFNSSFSKSFTIFLAALFLLFFFGLPEKALADWDSQADDLPGMSTGTLVLIGVGVAAAVTIFVLVSKSGKKAKDNEQKDIKDNSSEADSLQSSIGHSPIQLNLTDEDTPLPSGKEVQFIPYLSLAALQSPDMNFTKSQFNLSNSAVMAGVVVRF
jgi:hypothetical protein